MREFSDPKCFLRLVTMQDLAISNEIGFSPKCFSRSVSPNVESSDCKCRLQCKGLSETISLPNEINVFPRNVFSECFLSATVDCSECLCDCLLASTVAMANPATPTVREVRYEEMTGEQLAHDLARIYGRNVTDIQTDGVQVTLVTMNAAGELPFDRPDLARLARGERFVRPIDTVMVTARNGGRTLLVDGEIASSVPLEAMTSNQMIDANLGIRPDSRTAAMLVQPNAGQTASAGIPPTVPTPGTLNPEIGRNDFPVESLHLMNEILTTHRFSRNGPVNREVSAALSRMDMGKDVTKVWQRLDEYVTTDSQTECHKIEMDAGAIANRLHDAQVGLAEAVYRREWNDEWAPILSLLIPGTRSGGLSGCRFEHPDEHSNGPMSSLRLRMNSLGINVVQNGPNECMVETAWYTMSKAERMFLEKGHWHIEWKLTANAKENVVHDLVNVYDWIMLPASVGEKFFRNGTIELSKFPCHQLNGSSCALSAMRKTVQWYCQGCFDENADYEGVVFVVRRRRKNEAQRKWVTASNGKMKLENYFNRQFTDHISTQNG